MTSTNPMTESTLRRPHARQAGSIRALLSAATSCLFVLVAGGALAQQTKNDTAQKSATETAKKIQEMTGAKPSKEKLPPGDPCTVLTLSDVQKAFPGAKAGERSRRLEQYGVTECSWKGADGVAVLAVQESYADDTAKDDVQTMAWAITDPLNPKASGNVRLQTFPGMGSEAVAFVEQADPKRGILSDAAYMSINRGERSVSLSSGVLPRRERAAALKALEELGKVAAKRLQ